MEFKKHTPAFEDGRATWFMIGSGALIVLLVLYAGFLQTPVALSEIQLEPLATTSSAFYSSYDEGIGKAFGDWTDDRYVASLVYTEPVIEEIYPLGH